MGIRVLIADDSALTREVLGEILQASGELLLVGSACNGREAVEMTLALKPELVIMDLLMPVVDGLEAIEEIMATLPTPVLVLSAAIEQSEVDRAFQAIKRGALDVMEKPLLESRQAREEFALRLLEKVKLLAGIRVIRHPRRIVRAQEGGEIAASGTAPRLLAIGASTGGPKAMMTLLRSLPAGFSGSVLVVQHIAEGFAAGFASWLDRECAIPVRIAVDGEPCLPGEVMVAPDGRHLTVAGGRIRLLDSPPVNCCRPSIDLLFESLAQEPCDRVVAILLTGMGKDGAQGMLRIKERGGRTLVQDEESCAVFGMPKAAISLQGVDRVLPLEGMPAVIGALFSSSMRGECGEYHPGTSKVSGKRRKA